MTTSAREPKLTKTTGESEAFSEQKLRRSLSRSGADREQVKEIVAEVKRNLRDGMPTDEVFRISRRILQREHREAAARYSLQRAIQELGPDGFPFEVFIASLWRHEGFKVRTGVHMRGKHVRHDVDIVAKKGDDARLAECKFRSQNDGKVDIKIALYVHARAADLKAAIAFDTFWLITNGRFTRDALAYGEGVGMRLLAWNHPAGDGLRERIDRAGLHPVTALSSLHKTEHKVLLRQGIVIGSDLLTKSGVIAELGLGAARRKALWAEIEGLSEAAARKPEPKARTRAEPRATAAAVRAAEVRAAEARTDDDEAEAPAKKKRRKRGSRGGRGRGRKKAAAAAAAATATAPASERREDAVPEPLPRRQSRQRRARRAPVERG